MVKRKPQRRSVVEHNRKIICRMDRMISDALRISKPAPTKPEKK